MQTPTSSRVALVTGASAGIGDATVRAFLAVGMTVYAAARRVERMAPLEALGARVFFDGQIHEQVFGNGVVQQVSEFLGVDLQVLRRGLATVNRGGHAAGGAEFFDFGALHLRTRIGFQCD